MRALGFSTEETVALLAKFEKEGIDSDAVMGALSKAVTKLAKSHGDAAGAAVDVEKAQKALNDTLKKSAPGSVEAQAAQQKLAEAREKAAMSTGSIRDVLNDYIAKIKDAKTADDAAAISVEIFGKKGIVMAEAIRSGRLDMDALVESIANGTDTINAASLETMDFAEQWQLTKNRLMVAFEPAAAKVFGAIGEAMERNGPKIAQFAERVGPLLVIAIDTLIGVLNTALPIISTVAGVISLLGPAAVPVIVAIGGIITAFKGVKAVQGVFDVLPDKFTKIALSAVSSFGKMALAAPVMSTTSRVR